MMGFTLAQMRRSIPRLIAAGLAVTIGTAFVTATLLASGVIHRTTYDAIGAAYARADLVVADGDLTDTTLAAVASARGVAAADGVSRSYLTVGSGTTVTYVPAVPVASSPRLEAQELVDGELPNRGEIALPTAAAQRLGVDVGDRVTLTIGFWRETTTDPSDAVADAEGEGEWVEQAVDVPVSGIVADPTGAFLDSDGAALIDPADARAWSGSGDGDLRFDHILVDVLAGVDVEVARAAVIDALAPLEVEPAVRTRDEQAEHLAAQRSGATNLMTAVVLGFAAVALVVAAFVIANTFAVLVAQRTKVLALLRCVGASKRQVRRTVTLEALLLGIASSFVGVLVGAGLAQAALAYLSRRMTDVPLPGTVSLTVTNVAVPLVVGTVVAVLAAFAPARAAGRVAPLAALRPADAPSLHHGASRVRFVLALLLTIGGTGLLGLGMLAASVAGPLAGVAIGVLGGAASFAGVLLGAVFWVPPALGAAGRLIARVSGPATALAAANTVRNPRRTAATSSALLIGVTLVTMMTTGAASARHGLTAELDQSYAVDVEVSTVGDPTDAGMDPALGTTVRAIDGVDELAPVRSIEAVVRRADGDYHLVVHGVAATDARAVLRDPTLVDGLDADTLLVPSRTANAFGIESGQTVALAAAGPDGGVSTEARGTELTVIVTELPGWDAVATRETVTQISPDAVETGLWLRLERPGDAAHVTATIRDDLSAQPFEITGMAVERASYDRVIDTVLAIVVGLLGVAVVIAFVGVANTLSLAVIERRRESATLRAVGLSRRGLRRSLAVEGVLITATGAVLGAVLGTLYGWAGAWTVVGPVAGSAPLVVAWRDVALVLGVAVVAGLLASILPARSAVRTSPVAALATE